MTFVLSKVLWFLARPSMALLLLCCFGLALTWTRRLLGLGRRILALGLSLLASIMLLPVGNAIQLPLEDRFAAPTTPPADVRGVIILGGAVETELTQERGMPSLNSAAERMTEAVALARRHPEAQLAFAGGSGSVAPDDVTEAMVARVLWANLGLDPARIVFEDRSRTTYENAVFLKAIVHPRPGEVWLLVTSAAHMPRAVGVFRRVGWPVVPWPVGYKTGWDWRTWTHPSIGAHVDLADNAVHEWFGLLGYWATGRSSALFPGPE